MKKSLLMLTILIFTGYTMRAQTNVVGTTGNILVGSTTDNGTGAVLQVTGTSSITNNLNVNGAFNGFKFGTTLGGSYYIGNINAMPTSTSYQNMTIGNTGGALTSGAANFLAGTSYVGGAVTTGSFNTAVAGYGALASNTEGNHNTAIGNSSLFFNVSGIWNTALGSYSGINITGSHNTMIGGFAGVGITTGSNNTVIGSYYPNSSGITTGNYNTIIGPATGLTSSLSNNIILADGQGNQRLNVDNNGNLGIGITNPAAKLHIYGSSGTGTAAYISNVNNTSTTADASLFLSSGGANGGSPLVHFDVSSVRGAIMGLDNGDDSKFKISASAGFRNGDYLTILTGTNAGNVGIGTTSPAHIFHVAQDVTMNTDVNVAQFAVSGASDNAKRLIFGYDVNGAGFGYIKSGWLGHQWTNLSLQPNGGFVGIGTTSPTRLLDVVSGTGVGPLKVSGPNGSLLIDNVGSGESYYQANSFHQFQGDSGTPIMTMMGTGKVGIGTTNPAQNLHVNGGVRIDATATAYNEGLSINVPQSMGGYGGIAIHSTTIGGGYDATSIKWLLYHNYTPENNIGGDGFAIAQNNANTRFYISNTGNVSIGTVDSKGYLFAVAGPAIATSMTVKLKANWPDYVFSEGHELMPLADLKAYVDKNQHLPEIPSAAEVEKNGQDLGEMNKLLVKKMEEMTLYMLEKDRQIKDQEQRLKALEQQIEKIVKKD